MKKLILTLAFFSVLSVAKADKKYHPTYTLEVYNYLKEVTYSEIQLDDCYFKSCPPKPEEGKPVHVTGWIKTSDSNNKPKDNAKVWYFDFPETFRHPKHIHSLKSINQ